MDTHLSLTRPRSPLFLVENEGSKHVFGLYSKKEVSYFKAWGVS